MFSNVKLFFVVLFFAITTLSFTSPNRLGGTVVIIQDRTGSHEVYFDNCPETLLEKQVYLFDENDNLIETKRFVGEIVTVNSMDTDWQSGNELKLVLVSDTCKETKHP